MDIAKTAALSLVLGCLAQLAQGWLATDYLNEFLAQNLPTILIALLAINSATMGIVLTKIRTLVEDHGHGDVFKSTRDEMALSIKEQIWLIVLSIIVLTLADSPILSSGYHLKLGIDSVVVGVFIYSLLILYDTAKGVLQIIDFEP